MLRMKTWIWTVGLLFVETYVLFILWNVVHPTPAFIHILETVLPGFKWLSLRGLVTGLFECFLYGAYLAANFVVLHNFFYRVHQREKAAIESNKTAA